MGPMANRTANLLADLAECLNAMPGVFSTPQWGGRAYKIERPGRRRGAKLLAFVAPEDDGAIHVSFKIPIPQAATAVRQHDWIEPHSFRTLAPAGWLSATVRARKQLPVLKGFLETSYRLLGGGQVPQQEERPQDAGVRERIDSVMKDVAADGWEPQSDW